MEKLTPEDIDNRILGVRIEAYDRSISSFVASLQKYFPHYFKDIKFDEHSLKTEGMVVARVIENTALSEEVIYLATRYLVYMHYEGDEEDTYWAAKRKVRNDKNMSRLVDRWIGQTGGTDIDSVTAVVKLVSIECNVDIPDDIDTNESLRKDMLMHIAGPVEEVISFLDREGVIAGSVNLGCDPLGLSDGIIRHTHFCAITRETLWMINSSNSANSMTNRLRMISSYMAMKWDGIKRLGIIDPHGGKYYTIAIEEINADKKEIIRRCIQGTDIHDRPANEMPSSKQMVPLPPDLYNVDTHETTVSTMDILRETFRKLKKKEIESAIEGIPNKYAPYDHGHKYESSINELAINVINFITQYGQIDTDKCSFRGHFLGDSVIDTGHHLAHIYSGLSNWGTCDNLCPPYQYLYRLLYKHQREGLNYTAVSVIDMFNGHALVCNISDVPPQVMDSINKNVRIV